jgi:CRP/FNR family transcriptional regulator, cyclic AMP receptor protein
MANQEVVVRIVVDGEHHIPPTSTPPIPRIRKFKPGETIFQADDSSATFFVIVSGLVKVFKRYSVNGDQAFTRLIRPGDMFGESALCGDPRGMAAEAMEDSIVHEYDADAYMQSLRGSPDLAVDMIRRLAHKVRELSGEKAAPRTTMFMRLSSAVLALAEKDGEKVPGGILIPTKVTHEMLAGLIGARRETVTLHLKKLRKLKAIEQRDSGLFVQLDNLKKAVHAGELKRRLTSVEVIPRSVTARASQLNGIERNTG